MKAFTNPRNVAAVGVLAAVVLGAMPTAFALANGGPTSHQRAVREHLTTSTVPIRSEPKNEAPFNVPLGDAAQAGRAAMVDEPRNEAPFNVTLSVATQSGQAAMVDEPRNEVPFNVPVRATSSAYTALMQRSRALQARYGHDVAARTTMGAAAYRALMLRSESLDAAYGHGVAGGRPTTMSPTAYRALMVRSEALDARYAAGGAQPPLVGEPKNQPPFTTPIAAAAQSAVAAEPKNEPPFTNPVRATAPAASATSGFEWQTALIGAAVVFATLLAGAAVITVTRSSRRGTVRPLGR